jgi:hypothetical protein
LAGANAVKDRSLEVGDIPKKSVEEFFTENFSGGFGGKTLSQTPKKACTGFAIAGSKSVRGLERVFCFFSFRIFVIFLNMHVQSSAGGWSQRSRHTGASHCAQSWQDGKFAQNHLCADVQHHRLPRLRS